MPTPTDDKQGFEPGDGHPIEWWEDEGCSQPGTMGVHEYGWDGRCVFCGAREPDDGDGALLSLLALVAIVVSMWAALLWLWWRA